MLKRVNRELAVLIAIAWLLVFLCVFQVNTCEHQVKILEQSRGAEGPYYAIVYFHFPEDSCSRKIVTSRHNTPESCDLELDDLLREIKQDGMTVDTVRTIEDR